MPAGGGAVLLNLASDQYYSLNAAAASIWHSLAAGRTPDEAADALCREFEVTPDDARASVSAFLEQLAGEQLVMTERTHTTAPGEPNYGKARDQGSGA